MSKRSSAPPVDQANAATPATQRGEAACVLRQVICESADCGARVRFVYQQPAVRDHGLVTVNDPDARVAFDRKVRALEGLRVHAVDYWDIHNYGPEPARWDYGDWHHAVMGVQLSTDAGPVTVTWTSTFYPYGVEVFAEPIERHLVLAEDGPERIGPDGESRWTGILDTPVLRATTSWERIELGPATLASGEVVEPARVVEIPTALRLDFSTGPVWFAAAIPQYPSMERVFIPGDEIMIVFSAAKMRDMGYDDPIFLA